MTIGVIRPLKGLGRVRPIKPSKPVLKPDKLDLPSDMPVEIARMVPTMGERNARTVWRLQKRGIRGTAPELLVYDWLERKRVRFEFQSSQFGGRKIRGGIVTDFVVWIGALMMAWRVQGAHWHSSAIAKARDQSTKVRLLHTRYYGQKFSAVCDLGEMSIYKSPNHVCEDAMRGRSTPEWT